MRYPNIEAERARLGITKSELSNQIGVTPKTLTNWQNGKTPIPTAALIAMRKLFNCTIDYLLGLNVDEDGRSSA